MSAGDTELRAPSVLEKNLVSRLLTNEFAGRNELRAQVEDLRVREIDNNGSLELVPGGAAPLAVVQQRIPVEARLIDSDGMTISILLHVLDGLMNELEIYRDDSKPVQRELSPEEVKPFTP